MEIWIKILALIFCSIATVVFALIAAVVGLEYGVDGFMPFASVSTIALVAGWLISADISNK